ncbi:hypothetical protein VXS02_11080 [Photobacterium piscicola]|uniref:hypothetical protein n=1 Tax=Photobacterium piscicola TaxID=1378299 RepID=UPI002E18D64C|nr:hypothetical protein [Photobacterium piscicola]
MNEHQLDEIKKELRDEILKEHRSALVEARSMFQLALDDKNKYFDGNDGNDVDVFLYRSCIPKIIKAIKTAIQFCIGFCLIFILTIKGVLEIVQTFNLLNTPVSEMCKNILDIKTFIYISNALAISAGIELSYMLFTDGPDEAIEPLMLAIAAAAFYTVSESPENSGAMFGYAVSILVLMVCLKLYKRWKL